MIETNKKIEFTKIRDVKSPNRAHSTDAGTDWYIPNLTDEFVEALKAKNENNNLGYKEVIDGQGDIVLEITIPSGEQLLVPSGIKVNIIDKNTYLEANNKSGIATKYHLAVAASIVDADYQGEVHLHVYNFGNTDVKVVTGQKLIQFIHKYYIDTDWQEISNDEYNNLDATTRGQGGFGSSTLK